MRETLPAGLILRLISPEEGRPASDREFVAEFLGVTARAADSFTSKRLPVDDPYLAIDYSSRLRYKRLRVFSHSLSREDEIDSYANM